MTTRRLFVVLFGLSLFAMAVRETLDPDMWWHLRTGDVILRDGIPRHDVFSFTVPENHWITHEWLSQVFMWSIFRVGGLTGLMLLFAFIAAVSYWLIYLRCDGRPYLAAFVVLLAALASAPVWGVRPQMFNILFTAAFIFLIEGFKDGRVSQKTLWLLPPLTALWANVHSGYLLGIVLLATYLIGESAQLILGSRSERGLNWRSVRWLALMTLVSFLAAAINPNGPKLWIYPFFTLGSGAMQEYILEWQSPNFHLPIFWPFAVLLALGVVSWLLSRRLPTWTDILLFGGTAAAALTSARHIPLFALVAAPIIARYLLIASENTRLFPILSGKLPQTGSGLLFALNWAVLLLAVVGTGIWIGSKVQNNETAIGQQFPVSAVDFLQRSGLDHLRGFNSYNWGGYLIWRGIPVFVDGRADVYGDDFLRYYRRTFDLASRWREPLEEYHVDYVIMERSSALSTLLDAVGGWREAYADDVAVVFVRDDQ